MFTNVRNSFFNTAKQFSQQRIVTNNVFKPSLFNSKRSYLTQSFQKTYSSNGSSGFMNWQQSLLGITAAGLSYFYLNKEAESCGIIAFIGEEPAVNYLLEGLTILQNRGYDSAGCTTFNKDSSELITTKFASLGSTSDSIDLLRSAAPKIHGVDASGIAHTRWATHGGKTDFNAHPHLDYKSRIALVHNGTIENSHELKAELESKGIQFKSQTDTEVISQLIGHYLDENLPILDAVKKALSRLEGTWGLAILHKDSPNQIIAARNGSPLVIGLGQKRMFVASELSAFSRHTSQYISLNDGEVAVINADGMNLDLSRVQKAPHENIQLSPDPFPHWTIKEIIEQPEAMSKTLGYGARFDSNGNVKLGGMEDNKERLLPIKHLIMAACGTSLFASMYGAALFRSLKVFDTIQCVDAAEITNESFPPLEGGICVVSQSGETKDTHRALVLAQDNLLPAFSIINQVGSLIARTTNCGVYLNAGREHAVASTKAFTTQVTAMALIAGWYAQNKNKATRADKTNSLKRQELMEAIHRIPIYTGITLKTHDQCKNLASKLYSAEHMFILGKGYSESIAKEGALKIKEITYLHAEGFSGGALKHGPFALLEPGTPVILIILDDQHQELMRVAGAEVLARGALTVVITDKRELARDIATEENTICIPSNGPLSALLGVVPLQLLAYEIAVRRGINPDKPKNLAKAVTVD
jgi:glucosamine--fructose-6-phosphate aminotransferase (isomerizing)